MKAWALTVFLCVASVGVALNVAADPILKATDALSKVPVDGTTLTDKELLRGIDENINFFSTPEAQIAYQRFSDPEITIERVRLSLLRLRTIIQESGSQKELQEKLNKEFTLFRTGGKDGKGTVHFTGYFRPIYQASRVRTNEFRYPIYRLPDNFSSWQKPHPTRVTLEGYDGKGNSEGPLQGLELAWLRTRYEVFMIQVQGSAILELPTKEQISVGFAGGTDYPFKGVPKTYLQEKHLPWTKVGQFFSKYPTELDSIMSNNNRFIFFKESENTKPVGSLGIPVIAHRSIATDKAKLPPGAVGLMLAQIPKIGRDGKMALVQETRFVIDQDAGSAIKGPGRVDLFMGTGPQAQKTADSMYGEGELYYFLLRNT